jgi:hypothetical protein
MLTLTEAELSVVAVVKQTRIHCLVSITQLCRNMDEHSPWETGAHNPVSHMSPFPVGMEGSHLRFANSS